MNTSRLYIQLKRVRGRLKREKKTDCSAKAQSRTHTCFTSKLIIHRNFCHHPGLSRWSRHKSSHFCATARNCCDDMKNPLREKLSLRLLVFCSLVLNIFHLHLSLSLLFILHIEACIEDSSSCLFFLIWIILRLVVRRDEDVGGFVGLAALWTKHKCLQMYPRHVYGDDARIFTFFWF